jgi:hypothetical protein
VDGAAAAAEFLQELFGVAPADRFIHLWTLHNKRSYWIELAQLRNQQRLLARLAKKRPGNVYVGVALARQAYGDYKRQEANQAAGIVGLWADIDIRGPAHKETALPVTLEEAIRLACSLGLGPSVMVATGHGLQPWWLFQRPWVFADEAEREEAQRLVRRFHATLAGQARASGWQLDATQDLARLLRLAGTWNDKRHIDKGLEPIPVRVLERTDERYDPADFFALLGPDEAVRQPPRVRVERNDTHTSDDRQRVINRARAYIARMPASISGQRGHDKLWAVAQTLIRGFELTAEEARPLVDEFSDRCQPPWSEKEIQHKIVSAQTKSKLPRGYIVGRDRDGVEGGCEEGPRSSEADELPEQGDPGERTGETSRDEAPRITNAIKPEKGPLAPVPMAQILKRMRQATGDWPRRVGSVLFACEGEGVSWLESTAALFGFLGSKAGIIPWYRGTGCHPKEEVYQEVRRIAPAYFGVEVLPHEPHIEGLYYAHARVALGDGQTLERLIDRFKPATLIDRDLIKAAFVTLFWGGGGGTRPAFVITADSGRGAGKSKLAAMLGYLGGGVVELAADEDIEVIKQRLLSAEGVTKRVALIDNVKSRGWSSANLESLITTPVISGKRLYVGEATRLNVLTWVITLNGVSLGTDLAQRSAVIKLDKPERSGTWEEETYRFIDENRQKLIGDILGFLKGERATLERYSRWASWERGVLARLPEPADAQAVIAERQGQADVELEESDLIEDFFARKLALLGYNPDTEAVRIPSEVAARWYNLATNENLRVTAASRTLRQMGDEGRLRRLRKDAGHANGRGFLWTGRDANPRATARNDLEEKLRGRGEWPCRGVG